MTRILTGASTLVAVWLCACDTGNAGRLSGSIKTEDGRTGFDCMVSINSESEPFYTPVILTVTAGDSFSYSHSAEREIENVIVTIKCDGYEPDEVRHVRLSPTKSTSVGERVLKKRSIKSQGAT
jgi:hypothetical protein